LIASWVRAAARRRTDTSPRMSCFMSSEAISFTMNDEERLIRPGQSAFVPRGTKHAYVNTSETAARMIAVYTPSGMEGWFREVCTPVSDKSASPPPATPELVQRMHAAGPKYNIEWVD
jgi:glyoxylate utilization-related uncharacterized protein